MTYAKNAVVLAVLLLGATYVIQAVAAQRSSVDNEFVRLVESRINQVIKDQGSDFGGIDWVFLKSEVANIKIEVLPSNVHVTYDSRKTAHWFKDTNTIFISPEPSTILDQEEDRSLLYLHEFLGLKGVDDRNFQVTSGLKILGRTATSSLKQKISDSIQRSNTPKTNEAAGTSTVVGGGGDGFELLLKTKFVEAIMEPQTIQENPRFIRLFRPERRDLLRKDIFSEVLQSRLKFQFGARQWEVSSVRDPRTQRIEFRIQIPAAYPTDGRLWAETLSQKGLLVEVLVDELIFRLVTLDRMEGVRQVGP